MRFLLACTYQPQLLRPVTPPSARVHQQSSFIDISSGNTYRCISTFTQDLLACCSRQGLRTRYHTLGAMDGASPTGERHKALLLGVDSSGVQRHSRDFSKEHWTKTVKNQPGAHRQPGYEQYIYNLPTSDSRKRNLLPVAYFRFPILHPEKSPNPAV